MSWWATVIAAALGYVLGGPFGALLGAALGYSLSSPGVRAVWAEPDGGRRQAAFFTATFSVMGHLAKADGRVSEDEIRAARAVMAHMNLSPAQQRAAIELFNRGKQPDFPLETVLAELRAACRGRPDLLHVFLQIQLSAALADGLLHPAEREIFTRIGGLLGISPAEIRQYEEFLRAQQAFSGEQTASPAAERLAAAYRALGLEPAASDAQIKQAYRRLVARHHPDKLVARGLPEEMLKLAQERVQQLNAAYETLKEARGFK